MWTWNSFWQYFGTCLVVEHTRDFLPHYAAAVFRPENVDAPLARFPVCTATQLLRPSTKTRLDVQTDSLSCAVSLSTLRSGAGPCVVPVSLIGRKCCAPTRLLPWGQAMMATRREKRHSCPTCRAAPSPRSTLSHWLHRYVLLVPVLVNYQQPFLGGRRSVVRPAVTTFILQTFHHSFIHSRLSPQCLRASICVHAILRRAPTPQRPPHLSGIDPYSTHRSTPIDFQKSSSQKVQAERCEWSNLSTISTGQRLT